MNDPRVLLLTFALAVASWNWMRLDDSKQGRIFAAINLVAAVLHMLVLIAKAVLP